MIVEEQLRIFLYMMAAGFLIGFCVTFYERFITRGKKGLWRFFPDLLFWLGQALFVFLVLFQLNGADLRFYMCVALVIGFVIYWKVARGTIIRILNWLSWLLVTMIKILFLPFKWLWTAVALILYAIWQLLSFISRPFHPISLFLQKKWSILAKKIKTWLNLLYNRE
ncbi:spore cortex biosynthesis protein YabQ [Jeotgalibacillus salarius]|uniref:Spore cortex biosynthesis protein YabQ n=1 Tax=Jeotgalibacillus salarius TaxID=546023 RepID=A0A4Y8LA57_9BACL|nr:spore cortex biosynthesis protein YabQ [Jeotgalibacillus salarius]TFD98352.1 hypothetical protein E2626_15705 [Jeotgalibacillus salarius]